MELQISVAKIGKYATSQSGDTVEVVERPNGGLSVVMVDGQSSGKGAKAISNLAVRKVIGLLAEGVRDGAAARAASDSLYTERHGKVSATLNIISVDQQTQTLVITRNNPAPVIMAHFNQVNLLNDPSEPIGFRRDTRPVITEIPIEFGLTVVVFTDGLVHAGERIGERLDVLSIIQALLDGEEPSPQMITETLLEEALRLDQNRPVDDISIAAVRIVPFEGGDIRRMAVRLPLSRNYSLG